MSIVKAQKYVPVLDAKLKQRVKTSVFDSTDKYEYIDKAGTFLVATRSFEGLADYDRAQGYNKTSVNVDWDSYSINYDRGRMIVVDERDNEEAAGMAYLGLAGDFIDYKVGPEVERVHIKNYAGATGVHSVESTITTGVEAVAALRAGVDYSLNKYNDLSDSYLLINVTNKGLIEDMDSYKSKAVLAPFGDRILTFADTDLVDDVTLTAGGFTTPVTAKAINFMIVPKQAVIQITTHVAPKIVTPEVNQDADAYEFGYRLTGLNEIFAEKAEYIYVDKVAAGE